MPLMTPEKPTRNCAPLQRQHRRHARACARSRASHLGARLEEAEEFRVRLGPPQARARTNLLGS
jgi:hypothetical protein